MSRKRKIEEIRQKAEKEAREKLELEVEKPQVEIETGTKANAETSSSLAMSKPGKHEPAPIGNELLWLVKELSKETTRFQKETMRFQEETMRFQHLTFETLREHDYRLARLENHMTPTTSVERPAEFDYVAPAIPSDPFRIKGGLKNGPEKAYFFYDQHSQSYLPKKDKSAAKQAGNGECKEIWVWYKDGRIDHVLNSQEIIKYTP